MKPELEGILACSTDGKKALIDGFKENLRFAVFLRCFLHFKYNIKRDLTDRNMTTEAKNQYLAEIFGMQEGAIKYTGLVDCKTTDIFDNKLNNLHDEWEEREATNGSNNKAQAFFEWFRWEEREVTNGSNNKAQTFFEWFRCQKVRKYNLVPRAFRKDHTFCKLLNSKYSVIFVYFICLIQNTQ